MASRWGGVRKPRSYLPSIQTAKLLFCPWPAPTSEKLVTYFQGLRSSRIAVLIENSEAADGQFSLCFCSYVIFALTGTRVRGSNQGAGR